MLSLLPADLPALIAPAHPMAVVAGLANPDWAHVGLTGRQGRLGYALTLGTLSLAMDVTASGRYFFQDETGGPFLELGLNGMRYMSLSNETPVDWQPLLVLGLGYQFILGPCPVTLGLGWMPVPLMGSAYQPLIVTNASALPRVLVQTGFQF